MSANEAPERSDRASEVREDGGDADWRPYAKFDVRLRQSAAIVSMAAL